MEYYTILSALSIVISAALFIPIQQKLGNRSYAYFKLLMLSSVFRTICPLLELYFDEPDKKLLIFQISYVVTASLPVLWFLFSLEYSNKIKRLTKWHIAVLWIIPVISAVLAVTNRFHRLNWSNLTIPRADEGFILIQYERGLGLTVYFIYSCMLLAAGLIIMLNHLIRERIFTGSALILAGVLMPLILNILYERRSLPVDYTPIAVSLSAICFSWAILKGHIDKQLTIAVRAGRNIDEGVIFIDNRHDIAGINHKAQMIIGLPAEYDKIPAAEAIPFWEKMSFRLKKNADEVFEVSLGSPERRYAVHIRSADEKEKYPGWLVVLSDITDKKGIEDQLVKRDKLLTATVLVSGRFLEEGNLYDAVIDGIKIIGQALKADRAFLYENCNQEPEEGITLQLIFEWTPDDNNDSRQVQVQELKLPDCEEIRKTLVSGSLFCKGTGEIESPVLKDIFKNDGAASVLLLPVTVNGSLWGIIRYDGFYREELCPDSAATVLNIFSHAVSGAIGRGILENELVQGKGKSGISPVTMSRFLAGISDEIRTPMNIIMGFIDLLSQTDLNQEQAEHVREAASASETLLGLVNDILDYSKIEADNIELENIPFNPGALVEDAIMQLEPKSHKKGSELFSLIHSAVPEEVLGDPGRVRQILVNLIENAVKFAENGEIVVSVGADSPEDADICRLRFVVSYAAVGIPHKSSQDIFEPFTRVSGSTDGKHGGTGLGPAICKKLAGLMGGDIKVKSEEGKGSEFVFTLPAKKCRTAAAQLDYPTRRRLKILIADNNKKSLAILNEYLSPMHDIIEAGTVDEVLQTVKANVFDLIILDCRMPGIDGILLGKQFSLLLPDTRLIVTASAGFKGEARKIKESGFHGYLTKPIRKKDLYDCIDAIFCSDDSDLEQRLVTRHIVREQNFKKRSRVLLAEADDKSRRQMLLLLKKSGIIAEIAENGYEAVNACNRKKYDLIFLNCRMPAMDGYKAAAEIRENSQLNSDTPIVAMAEDMQADDIRKSTGTYISDCLYKPITQQRLNEVLKRFPDIAVYPAKSRGA